MQIVRTILWILVLVALLLFSWANWDPGVTVRIWNNIVVDTRLPAVVLISFLAGLVPMWLLYRGAKWRMNRRIKGLEEASRASGVAVPAAATTNPDPSVRHNSAPVGEQTRHDEFTQSDLIEDRPTNRPALP